VLCEQSKIHWNFKRRRASLDDAVQAILSEYIGLYSPIGRRFSHSSLVQLCHSNAHQRFRLTKHRPSAAPVLLRQFRLSRCGWAVAVECQIRRQWKSSPTCSTTFPRLLTLTAREESLRMISRCEPVFRLLFIVAGDTLALLGSASGAVSLPANGAAIDRLLIWF
jgi:hypothetical protein